MHTPDFKQFSVRVKVPWKILYHHPEDMRRAFEEILGGYISAKTFRVSARVFPHALKCRLTVIFKDRQRNGEAIEELINKVAKRTLFKVITEDNEKT